MIRDEDEFRYDPDDNYSPAPEEEFWDELYEIEPFTGLGDDAVDEDGFTAECDFCGCPLKFDDKKKMWVCKPCDIQISRVEWFRMIGADPPGPKCLTQCNENYPICKIDCPYYDIPKDDPMLRE